jgi:hypothetical protein
VEEKEACWHPVQLSQAKPSMKSFWGGMAIPESDAASFGRRILIGR